MAAAVVMGLRCMGELYSGGGERWQGVCDASGGATTTSEAPGAPSRDVRTFYEVIGQPHRTQLHLEVFVHEMYPCNGNYGIVTV